MPEAQRSRFRRSRLLALGAMLGAATLLTFAVLRPTGDEPGATPDPGSGPGRVSSPEAAQGPGIGAAAPLADGAVARLNGVTADVSLEPGLPGPEAGMRLDRLDVEMCAGGADLFVDAAFWNGLGDDQRVHSAHMGVRSFFTLTMAPGSCQRGSVDLTVVEGVELVAVLLMDTSQTMVARWSAGGEPGDTVPLASDVRANATALGSQVELVVGGSATLHAVDLDAEPSARAADTRGGGLVSVDAELCAGLEPIPTSPRHWFLRLADHRLVGADPNRSTVQAGTLDAEGCSRGTIDFPLPAGSPPAGVLYAYGGQFELASWVIDR